MKDSVDPKYMVVLAIVAVLILVGGALLKPKKAVPEPPSPSETATLQARIERDDLAATASYLAQRAQFLARYILYERDRNASAVVWEKSGQILTTAGAHPGLFDPPLLLLTRDSETPPPPPRASELNAKSRWLTIVGRTANDRLVWTLGIYGGSRQSTCSGVVYEELVVNAPLDGGLSGAGAFDLDGTLHGIVAPCDGMFRLVSVTSVSEFLRTFNSPGAKIRSTYGFAGIELDNAAKGLFATESGIFVTEVVQDGAALKAGLKPGDLILSVARRPVENLLDLADTLAVPEQEGRVLEVLRTGRHVSVKLPSADEASRTASADSTLGIRVLSPLPTGDTIVVGPDTPAYRSGLRTGDRVIQVGQKPNRAPADLTRALSQAGDRPVLVFYLRGTSQGAALVTK